MTRLLRSMATLRGRIGLIADVQYCDLEDGTDFSGVQVRRYRHSLEVLARAVEDWNSQGQFLLLAQLGDLVDGKAGEGVKNADSSEIALEAVRKVLAGCECKDVVNVIGNHELYNFSRERLGQLLDVRRGEEGRTWFSFLPLQDYKLRIVVLDSYDISTIESCKTEENSRAVSYLRKHNPNDVTSFGVDWSAGLAGLERRFMPYNGMVGEEQLAWLERSLEEAAGAGERVLVLCHVPLCPGASDPLCLLWNYNSVLAVLDSRPGTVLAVMAGHDHEGGVLERRGVWHLTLPSPLLAEEGGQCWGGLELWEDRLEWRGQGRNMPGHIVMPL